MVHGYINFGISLFDTFTEKAYPTFRKLKLMCINEDSVRTILTLWRSVEEDDIGGKIASDILPDLASRRYQDVRYSQNVMQFHSRRLSVFSF
jgi:hypothetical protein